MSDSKQREDKRFEVFTAFLAWIGLLAGSLLRFPFGERSKGWWVEITHQGVQIVSSFYRVAPGGKYGAAMIHGHCYPVSGTGPDGEPCRGECSGVVEFGIEDDVLVVLNRRRWNEGDQLGDEQVLITITNGANPDRLIEPVAVVASATDLGKIQGIGAEQRLAFMDRMRDGVALDAARHLFRWAPLKSDITA